MNKNTLGIGILVIVLVVAAVLAVQDQFDLASGDPDSSEVPMNSDQATTEIFETDGVKHSIPLDEVQSGGPSKDGIPSIDDPQFESVSDADTYLRDEGLGIGYVDGDEQRFYPFQILVWHEIVNDTVAGTPIVVTYCPLCGTGIAFERTIDGEAVEFGVSGQLYNSDLLMYDRKTDTLWSQILGKGVVGELTGTRLPDVLFSNLTWADWKTKYPDSEVLSRETGHTRNYTATPYEGYEDNEGLYFPVSNVDDRLPNKEWVVGVALGNNAKAWRLSDVEAAGEITDVVGETPVRVVKEPDNGIKVFNAETDERITSVNSFWFGWVAFYPETELYE